MHPPTKSYSLAYKPSQYMHSDFVTIWYPDILQAVTGGSSIIILNCNVTDFVHTPPDTDE